MDRSARLVRRSFSEGGSAARRGGWGRENNSVRNMLLVLHTPSNSPPASRQVPRQSPPILLGGIGGFPPRDSPCMRRVHYGTLQKAMSILLFQPVMKNCESSLIQNASNMGWIALTTMLSAVNSHWRCFPQRLSITQTHWQSLNQVGKFASRLPQGKHYLTCETN